MYSVPDYPGTRPERHLVDRLGLLHRSEQLQVDIVIQVGLTAADYRLYDSQVDLVFS